MKLSFEKLCGAAFDARTLMVELLSRGNVVGREMARQRLGVRQPSGAFSPCGWRGQSARGLAHSKTSRTFLARLQFWNQVPKTVAR